MNRLKRLIVEAHQRSLWQPCEPRRSSPSVFLTYFWPLALYDKPGRNDGP
jgi:hypothetical protein